MPSTTLITVLVDNVIKASRLAFEGDERQEEAALGYLKELAVKEINGEMLIASGIGKKINRLTRRSTPAIRRSASALVNQWKAIFKKFYESNKDTIQFDIKKSRLTRPRENRGYLEDTRASLEDLSVESGNIVDNIEISKSSSGTSSGKEMKKTGNAVRDRLRLMLSDVLKNEGEKLKVDYVTLAIEIECEAFNHFEGVNDQYKERCRSIQFNLKDPKNVKLRERVLRKELPATYLMVIPIEELANEEKKRENKDIREKMMEECDRTERLVATTDAFKCSR